MDLPPIDVIPEPAKIISLSEARNKFRPEKCQHRQITVDEDLFMVECTDCGEKLNPVAVLVRFAREESRWQRNAEALKDLHRKLDARVRCRCQHCGQMTRIKP